MHKYWIVFSVLGLLGTVSAQLDNIDREEYQSLVDRLCHAHTSYPLELSLEEASTLYHQSMDCLFSQASVQAVNARNNAARTKLKSFFLEGERYNFTSDQTFEDIVWETANRENCSSLEAIIKAQLNNPSPENGYKSRCVADNTIGLEDLYTQVGTQDQEIRNYRSQIEMPFSACKVTETALNEYCAYSQYMTWKARDETTVQALADRSIRSNLDFTNNQLSQFQAALQQERAAVKQTLDLALETYQRFEASYAEHLWWQLLRVGLEKINHRSQLVREALSVWSYKFHDSNTTNCTYGCSQ